MSPRPDPPARAGAVSRLSLAAREWEGVEKARGGEATRANQRPRLPGALTPLTLIVNSSSPRSSPLLRSSAPPFPRSQPPPPIDRRDAVLTPGSHRFQPRPDRAPRFNFQPPEFLLQGLCVGVCVCVTLPPARARHGHVLAVGAVAAAARVAHGAAGSSPAPVRAARGGGGGGGAPLRGGGRRGERRGRGLGRGSGGGGRRPAAVPARGAGGGAGGGGGPAQGGVPVPHQLRPHLRAALGALLRRERGSPQRVRPRRPGRAPAPPRHALVPGPLRRRQAHAPRRRQPHRRLAPPAGRRAARRPRQRLLRAAVAALRPAPLLPAPLRRPLPAPLHRRLRRAPPRARAAPQLHRSAHGRAADAVALRGARRGRHAPRGPLRPVPHRLPVLHPRPPPRRARGPGAPPLAQVPAALPAGDGAGLVLPGGELLPDAARHGGPRRRRALHAHPRQLDRQRRGPPAHVHRPGGHAAAHRRPPRLQPHPPPHVRAQVRARLPRPAHGHRRLRHLQGLTAAVALLPGCSAARPRGSSCARRQREQWPSLSAVCIFRIQN